MAKEILKKNLFEETHSLKRLKLLVVIVNDGQAENICSTLSKKSCAISVTTIGVGTANADVYDVLGFGEKKKQIVVGIIQEEKIEEIKTYLNGRFMISKFAKGIAFTINISSVAGIFVYKFLTDTRISNEVKKHEKRTRL